MRKKGIRHRYNEWTPRENEIVLDARQNKALVGDIVALLAAEGFVRTYSAVADHLSAIGAKPVGKLPLVFSEREKQIIIAGRRAQISYHRIACRLREEGFNRTQDSVRAHWQKLAKEGLA